MGCHGRSPRIIFDGFLRYNFKIVVLRKPPIQEPAVSRHSFCSRPNLGEFSRPTILQKKKQPYNVDSNNNYVVEELKGCSRRWKRWIRNLENVVVMMLFGSGVAVSIYLGKWETVPYTKRRHFVLWSAPSDVTTGERKSEEIKKIFKRNLLPPLHPDSVRVRTIAQALIEAFRRGSNKYEGFEGWNWEVLLLDVPSLSTRTITYPGGKILIFRERLDSCGEDAEIAALIAPEVGHAVARHTVETQAMLLVLPSILVLILHLFLKPAIVNSMPSVFNFLRLPFARSLVYIITWTAVSRLAKKFYALKMDVEADCIGLLLLASAGYDPRVALEVREKMGRINGTGSSAWEKMRARLLVLDMEEALSIYREVMAERDV